MLTKEEELELTIRAILAEPDSDICRHILNLNAEIERDKKLIQPVTSTELQPTYKKKGNS